MFQPQKNVTSHRLNLNRFSVSGPPATYVSHGEEPSKTSIAVREHRISEHSLTAQIILFHIYIKYIFFSFFVCVWLHCTLYEELYKIYLSKLTSS